MKLRKRIAALGAAMTMAVSMMNIGASAYGTIPTGTPSGTTGNRNISYSYADVDGNYTSGLKNEGSQHGKIARPGFKITTAGTYTISFSGSSGAGATLIICRVDGNSLTQLGNTIGVPLHYAGMPSSVPAYHNFTPGIYCIKVVSTSSSVRTAGSFTVKGVNKEITIPSVFN